MNDLRNTLDVTAERAETPMPANDGLGWYLYGITRAEPGTRDDVLTLFPPDINEPVESIALGDVMGVVRRVPVDDFSPETLSIKAEDPAWIERMVREHNAIIEAIHRTRTVLPAKFGCVYATPEDVKVALQNEHDILLVRLNWLDNCDEWGIHLYGDIGTMRQRADTEQESLQNLRQDLASASPGRAYFLHRRMADEIAKACDRLLEDLTGHAYDLFARHSKAGQVSRRMAGSRITQDEAHDEHAEVLRAAFLVSRESTDAFIEDVRHFSESQPGLWCEYSGPWPPYSFAAETGSIEQSEEE